MKGTQKEQAFIVPVTAAEQCQVFRLAAWNGKNKTNPIKKGKQMHLDF